MKVIDGYDLADHRRDVSINPALADSAGVQLATSAPALTKTSLSITFITIIGLAERTSRHPSRKLPCSLLTAKLLGQREIWAV